MLVVLDGFNNPRSFHTFRAESVFEKADWFRQLRSPSPSGRILIISLLKIAKLFKHSLFYLPRPLSLTLPLHLLNAHARSSTIARVTEERRTAHDTMERGSLIRHSSRDGMQSQSAGPNPAFSTGYSATPSSQGSQGPPTMLVRSPSAPRPESIVSAKQSSTAASVSSVAGSAYSGSEYGGGGGLRSPTGSIYVSRSPIPDPMSPSRYSDGQSSNNSSMRGVLMRRNSSDGSIRDPDAGPAGLSPRRQRLSRTRRSGSVHGDGPAASMLRARGSDDAKRLSLEEKMQQAVRDAAILIEERAPRLSVPEMQAGARSRRQSNQSSQSSQSSRASSVSASATVSGKSSFDANAYTATVTGNATSEPGFSGQAKAAQSSPLKLVGPSHIMPAVVVHPSPGSVSPTPPTHAPEAANLSLADVVLNEGLAQGSSVDMSSDADGRAAQRAAAGSAGTSVLGSELEWDPSGQQLEGAPEVEDFGLATPIQVAAQPATRGSPRASGAGAWATPPARVSPLSSPRTSGARAPEPAKASPVASRRPSELRSSLSRAPRLSLAVAQRRSSEAGLMARVPRRSSDLGLVASGTNTRILRQCDHGTDV